MHLWYPLHLDPVYNGPPNALGGEVYRVECCGCRLQWHDCEPLMTIVCPKRGGGKGHLRFLARGFLDKYIHSAPEASHLSHRGSTLLHRIWHFRHHWFLLTLESRPITFFDWQRLHLSLFSVNILFMAWFILAYWYLLWWPPRVHFDDVVWERCCSSRKLQSPKYRAPLCGDWKFPNVRIGELRVVCLHYYDRLDYIVIHIDFVFATS